MTDLVQPPLTGPVHLFIVPNARAPARPTSWHKVPTKGTGGGGRWRGHGQDGRVDRQSDSEKNPNCTGGTIVVGW